MRTHGHPVDVRRYREAASVEDVALATAANVMRGQLEQETGDKLAVAIALRVIAPAIAAYHAALVAQREVS